MREIRRYLSGKKLVMSKVVFSIYERGVICFPHKKVVCILALSCVVTYGLCFLLPLRCCYTLDTCRGSVFPVLSPYISRSCSVYRITFLLLIGIGRRTYRILHMILPLLGTLFLPRL